MSTYWIMLLIPALAAMTPVRLDHNLQRVLFWLIGLVLIIIIGYRHEIGGDWFRYVDTAYGIQKGTPFDFLSIYTGDYGYRLSHWFSVNYLNGIYGTNLINAVFFVSGLIRFCRFLPMPWVALLVSIPFLVIVVSMGYTRQGTAIGFLMWGLVDLINEKKYKFYLSIILGSLFHFTVLIMIPVGIVYNLKKVTFLRISLVLILFSLSAALVFIFFDDMIERMVYYYITIKFHHSDGAIVRVFMSFFAASIFFIYRKKFKERYKDERLWFIFSVVSIALLPIAFQYSTFVDRIAIYFLPIQMVVFSRVPALIQSDYIRTYFVILVLFMYFLALFIWLYFGNFSSFWLPYKNMLLN